MSEKKTTETTETTETPTEGGTSTSTSTQEPEPRPKKKTSKTKAAKSGNPKTSKTKAKRGPGRPPKPKPTEAPAEADPREVLNAERRARRQRDELNKTLEELRAAGRDVAELPDSLDAKPEGAQIPRSTWATALRLLVRAAEQVGSEEQDAHGPIPEKQINEAAADWEIASVTLGLTRRAASLLGAVVGTIGTVGVATVRAVRRARERRRPARTAAERDEDPPEDRR